MLCVLQKHLCQKLKVSKINTKLFYWIHLKILLKATDTTYGWSLSGVLIFILKYIKLINPFPPNVNFYTSSKTENLGFLMFSRIVKVSQWEKMVNLDLFLLTLNTASLNLRYIKNLLCQWKLSCKSLGSAVSVIT